MHVSDQQTPRTEAGPMSAAPPPTPRHEAHALPAPQTAWWEDDKFTAVPSAKQHRTARAARAARPDRLTEARRRASSPRH